MLDRLFFPSQPPLSQLSFSLSLSTLSLSLQLHHPLPLHHHFLSGRRRRPRAPLRLHGARDRDSGPRLGRHPLPLELLSQREGGGGRGGGGRRRRKRSSSSRKPKTAAKNLQALREAVLRVLPAAGPGCDQAAAFFSGRRRQRLGPGGGPPEGCRGRRRRGRPRRARGCGRGCVRRARGRARPVGLLGVGRGRRSRQCRP